MLICNDLHIGVTRSGGTTPQSQAQLRDYLRESLQTTINTEDREVTVNGDLLDGFSIDTSEVVKVYEILAEWLAAGQRRTLNLVQGNHDWNPRGDKLSSFHLLCHFLTAHFDNQVRVFDSGFAPVSESVFCIPHMPNQSLFDLEIEKATAYDGKGNYLLLHCNIKNGFSEHSDHSLNINDEQLGNLMRAGWHIVVGHEHQGYELRSGRVLVVGNQVPSSVSDCIGDPVKNALVIDDAGHRYVQTWKALERYVEVDWREPNVDGADFIRVVGDATALEAADVIKAVSRMRQTSDAFVISQSVKIEGQEMISDMADQSSEDIRAFDVLSAIFAELSGDEITVVKELLL